MPLPSLIQRLKALVPGRRHDTASRLRAGITLVAATAVLLTAVPLMLYSLLTGARIEQQRIDLIGGMIAQNLSSELQSLRADLVAMAASPVVATALTDSAGREAYLRPFLQQRATSLGATMVLLDYRGRELLRTNPTPGMEGDTPEQPAATGAHSFAVVPLSLSGSSLVHRAPIVFFVNQRVIGALELRMPLGTVLGRAARGFTEAVDVALLHGGGVIVGHEDSGLAAAWRRVVVAVAGEGGASTVELTLAYRSRSGQLPDYLAGSTLLVLVMALLSLAVAMLAARRMARRLTEPLSLLVVASERFRAGEIPDLRDLQSVTEIAQLGQALTDAFVARDEAQREIRRYSERMLDGLPIAIFSGEVQTDGDFDLDYISPSVTRITGWHPEALRTLSDFANKGKPGAGEALRGFMLGGLAGDTATLDYPLYRADGSLSWLRLRTRVSAPDSEGSRALVAGTLTDVTDERRMAEQTVNTAKLATLGEMATGLAHELNQPLAVITLAAENTLRSLARNDPSLLPGLSARQQRIIQHAMRARTIVDHLRIFGRHDAGELSAIRLQDAIEGAKILVGRLLRESSVTLDSALSPDLPPVWGRLVPVEQVLVNLLVNARDAIGERGDPSGAVTLSAVTSGEMLVLSVRDSGPGFPPEMLSRIFEPFFTTKEVGKGTGLGLSICHGIMKSFGGTIEAANHPGGGAEFRLSFRIAPKPGAPTGSELSGGCAEQ